MGLPSRCVHNQEMIVHGEDDSRDPPGSWQYASKCLLISSQKMVPPNGFLTSGSHAIVNVVNKRENCTMTSYTRDPVARPVIFVFEMEAGCQLGCAGHSGLSSQPFLLCYHKTNPVVFSFLKMASPVFCSFAEYPTKAYLLC